MISVSLSGAVIYVTLQRKERDSNPQGVIDCSTGFQPVPVTSRVALPFALLICTPIRTRTRNPSAFEADDHNVSEGWSVIVTGRARVLYTSAEEEEAERAQLLPWTATLKRRYVRVLPSEITGRRFRFGSAPDHDGPFA